MKILHFADLHIGHENYGKIDPKTGLNTRLLDFLNSFDAIAEQSKKVDLVVFAGDAYKTRDPSPTYQREFSKRIKKIARHTPVVLVIGNHDIPSAFGKADTLEIFPTLEVPNVYVFSKPSVEEIAPSDKQSAISILALPWLSKTALLEEKERRLSTEQTTKILEKKISQTYQNLLKKIDPKKPCIAAVHQTIAGAMYSSNQDVYLGSDPVIPVSVLTSPKVSYVALGHLHKFQVLNQNPPVIYSGSPERIDFGEGTEEKGFVIAEIEKGKKTKWQFVNTPAREFKTILLKIPKQETKPNEYVLKKLKVQKSKIKDAIVKIQIEGKEAALSQVLDSDIQEVVKNAFSLANLTKKSEEKTVKIEVGAEELGPNEWLKKYLEIKQFNKQEAKTLTEEAEKIFEEIR